MLDLCSTATGNDDTTRREADKRKWKEKEKQEGAPLVGSRWRWKRRWMDVQENNPSQFLSGCPQTGAG